MEEAMEEAERSADDSVVDGLVGRNCSVFSLVLLLVVLFEEGLGSERWREARSGIGHVLIVCGRSIGEVDSLAHYL